jgi:aldoxime dehydratase
MHKNRPRGFVPPYEAYVSEFEAGVTEIANVHFGVQDRGDAAAAEEAVTGLAALFRLGHAPDRTERGWCEEPRGCRTWIHTAYWKSPESFRRWWLQEEVQAWLDLPARAGVTGRWAEVLFPQTKLLDTLIAHPEHNFGIAKLAKENVITPYHGYWGGVRDRMEALEELHLHNPAGDSVAAQRQRRDGAGRRLCVEMPANVCFARGGPDWSRATGEERELFLADVFPALEDGARYLAGNPDEAGCYTCRFVHELNADGSARDQVNVLAYYVTLRNLEHWTAKHPTHLAIHGRFLAMLRRIGRMPDVLLDHEISVLPHGKLAGIYVNCVAATGFSDFGTESARMPDFRPGAFPGTRPRQAAVMSI